MPHAKATIAGRTIAETDNYEVVEGNIYVCTCFYYCILHEWYFLGLDFCMFRLLLTIVVPAIVRQIDLAQDEEMMTELC